MDLPADESISRIIVTLLALGMDRQAKLLAREVAAILPEINEQESFWSGFSFSVDIDSEPSAFRFRSTESASPDTGRGQAQPSSLRASTRFPGKARYQSRALR